MRILVVAAKTVGLECVRFLTERFPADDYTFVVGEAGRYEIEDFLKKNGQSYLLLTNRCMQEIAVGQAGQFDWLLNLWGNYIYQKNMLSVAKSSLNIHPSFLPYGRGSDPIVWTIQQNWPAGASLHVISEGIDEGAVWARKEVSYSFPCKGKSLYEQTIAACISLFEESWPSIRVGEIESIPQREASPTKRRRQLLEDRITSVQPGSPLYEFLLRVLAHDFSPAYTAQLKVEGKLYNVSLNIEDAEDLTS